MQTSAPISPALSIAHPITLTPGKNACVWDSEGREYSNFTGVLNLGHCNPQGGPGTQELAKVLQSARGRGLLLMPSGESRHVIRPLAPLAIDPERLDQGLHILGKYLAECY